MSKPNRFYEIDFSNGSNVETLRYQIIDSPIADAWWNIVQRALLDSSCCISNNQWIQGASGDSIDLLWRRMKMLVDELNTGNYGQMPQLVMPAEFDAGINHTKLLNYLHLQFHKFAEKKENYTEDYTPLTELNLIIHKIEAVLQDKLMACGFHLEWLYKGESSVIDIENMDWYQHWTLDGQFGDMTLGYHTVGKNLWMCYKDNDIDLVRTGMVRPQRTISSEVNLLFGNVARYHNKDKFFLLMCEWMKTNNLTQYVDMTKPYNCAVGQPLLGKLVGTYTRIDINRILSLGRVGAVRLVIAE